MAVEKLVYRDRNVSLGIPKGIFYYYSLLFLIQLSWINIDVGPSTLFYVLYSFAVFIPLFKYADLLPFIFTWFYITKLFYISTYSYLASDNVMYLIAITFFIYGLWRKSVKCFRGDFVYIIITFIYWLVIDSLNGISFLQGPFVKNATFLVFLFPLIYNKNAIYLMGIGFIISSSVISLSYIVYGVFFGFMMEGGLIREFGWSDANYLSVAIGSGYLVTLIYYLGYLVKNSLRKILLLLLLGIDIFAIVLSGSRGGIIVVSVISLIALLMKNNTKQVKQKIILIVIFGCLILILSNYGFLDLLMFKFQDRDSLITGSGRTLIITTLFDDYIMQPISLILFGGGYGSFENLGTGMDPHNNFVVILASYGIFGLVLFVLILLRFLKNSNKISILILIFIILASLSISPFQRAAMPLLFLFGLKSKLLGLKDWY